MRLELFEPRRLLATVTGTVFEDLDADGVQNAGEVGLSGWTIYDDVNDNGVYDAVPPIVASNSTVKPIPDQSTITSTIAVSGVPSPIARVTVSVNIDHTWDADLDVFLISPIGTRVELFTDIGIGEHGVAATLDDLAAQSIVNATGTPITGTWRPESPLSALVGQSGNGTWTLEVTDDAQYDVGQLNSWSISIGTGEAATVSSASGSFTLSSLPIGLHKIRQILQSGWERTYPVADVYSINLPSAGSTSTGLKFGNRLPPGQINGFVFADYNQNGTKDAGEPGQSGWTVFIDTNNDSVAGATEVKTTSGADGSYSFINLKPGQYTIREVVPSDWVQTTPGIGGVVLVPVGAQSTSVTKPISLGAAKFSKERIVVAFSAPDGLASLRRQQRNLSVAGLFDLGHSSNLLSANGLSLVDVALPAGADPIQAVERFRSLSGVAWAQPDYVYDGDPREFVPNDPSYGLQYHHTLTQNNLAWNTTLGDPSVIIAITDDGVSLSHSDLAANIWVNSDEIAGNGIDDDGNGFIDDVHGWDFSSNDNDPNPVGNYVHGTHVAGIAAARTNNATGVAGVAGGSTIMPIRFYGSGAWTSTVIANSFKYAADNGAKIVSTSYTIDGFVGDSIFTAGLQYLYDHGVLYLNSAGNNSQANPARQAFDQGLFVASTTSADTKSSFSNYGYGIDIAAPGSSIYSTLPGNTYGTLSGTSMAAPNAAGVAALIWSAHPTWTRDQVAAQLVGTADNIDGLNPSYAGQLGGGRVNSYRGVTQTVAAPRIKSLGGLPDEGTGVKSLPTTFTLDVANVLNPATVTAGAFELRGDGLDNIFGTGDDPIIPLTLNTTYRIGTNRLTFTISGTPGGDQYRFSALPLLKDPFGQSLDGDGNGTGGDAFTRTFVLTGVTNPLLVTVQSNLTTSGDFGNANPTPPTVLGASFNFQTGHSIQMQFSQDVNASLSWADLVLKRQDGVETIIDQVDESYESSTNTATFTFGGLPGGLLGDGNYTATLVGAGTQSIFHVPLDGNSDGTAGGDFVLNFFVLAGDSNHDRNVNLYDLVALATHFGQTGMTFSEGDFDYNGTVNSADLGILATHWQQSLLPPHADAPKSDALPPARQPVRSPTRVSTTVAQSLLA